MSISGISAFPFQTGLGISSTPGGFSQNSFGTPGITGFGFPPPFVDPKLFFAPAAHGSMLNMLLGGAAGLAVPINFGPISSTLGVSPLLLGFPFFGGGESSYDPNPPQDLPIPDYPPLPEPQYGGPNLLDLILAHLPQANPVPQLDPMAYLLGQLLSGNIGADVGSDGLSIGGSNDQTTSLMNRTSDTPPRYQNQSNRLDVNNDGHVSPIDALIIINLMNNVNDNINLRRPPAELDPNHFVDVNGDNRANRTDVDLVINWLNRNQ